MRTYRTRLLSIVALSFMLLAGCASSAGNERDQGFVSGDDTISVLRGLIEPLLLP